MDVPIIDVIWNGFAESFKIAAMADVYEMNVAPHNFYGHLCTAISAHLCAAVPNFRIMEIDIDSVTWRDEFVTAPPVIENGELVLPTGPGWGIDVNEKAVRARAPKKLRGNEMAKFKIVTPAGASFTVAGGGYDLEMEALSGMDAEIVECPATEEGFIAGHPGRRCRLCQGDDVQQEDDRRPAREMPGHHPGHRRGGLRGRGGGDRARHPRHQLPGHLHRGGRRPRDGAAAGGTTPPDRAGPHGARGALARRAAAAAGNPPPDGLGARVHRVRAGGAADGTSGEARSGCGCWRTTRSSTRR